MRSSAVYHARYSLIRATFRAIYSLVDPRNYFCQNILPCVDKTVLCFYFILRTSTLTLKLEEGCAFYIDTDTHIHIAEIKNQRSIEIVSILFHIFISHVHLHFVICLFHVERQSMLSIVKMLVFYSTVSIETFLL